MKAVGVETALTKVGVAFTKVGVALVLKIPYFLSQTPPFNATKQAGCLPLQPTIDLSPSHSCLNADLLCGGGWQQLQIIALVTRNSARQENGVVLCV